MSTKLFVLCLCLNILTASATLTTLANNAVGTPQLPQKILKQSPMVDPGTGTVIQTGIGCGFYRMVPNQVIQIQSSNYGVAQYDNNESCVWRFTGDNCLLAAKCPCFNVPASFQCFGDYLKISDSILYQQRFCGDVAPQGAYRSVSGHLGIQFRTDYKGYAGRGFLCYVFCTEPGLADPALSLVDTPANCFGGPAGEEIIPPGVVGPVPIGGNPPVSPPPRRYPTPNPNGVIAEVH